MKKLLPWNLSNRNDRTVIYAMGFKSFWFEEICLMFGYVYLSQGYQPLCKEAGVYFISSKVIHYQESSVNRSERMRMFRLKTTSTQHSAVSAS